MKKQRHHLLKTLVTMLLVVTMVLSTAVTAMAAPGGRWGRGWNWGSWGSSAAETAEEEEPAVESEPEAAVEEAAEEPAAEEEVIEAEEVEEPAAEEEAEEPAAEEEEAEEETPEISYPAQDLETSDGKLTVKVQAPEGALPEGAKLQIEKVNAEDYQSEVEDVAGEGVKIALAVDITFLTADGEPIEPNGDVKVTMSAPEIEKIEKPEIVHIPDEGSAEKIAQADEDSADDEVVFESGEFSVYAVVWNDGSATIRWGYMDGTTFRELEEGSTVTMDTTAQTISLKNSFEGYYYRDAVYCTSGQSMEQGVEIDSILYKTDNGWALDAITTGEDERPVVTRTPVADGSTIYVIYYQPSEGQVHPSGSGDNTVPSPETTKNVTYNGDGTYTIQLDIAGATVTEDNSHYVNVLIVLDATYSMNGTKWTNAKAAMKALIETLCEGENAANAGKIDFALVTFGRSATVNQGWTKDNAAFKSTCAGLRMVDTHGTNWEAGMRGALYGVLNTYPQGESAENHDPTYVIFLTDGDPNVYYSSGNNTNYTDTGTTSGWSQNAGISADHSKDEAKAIAASTYLYGIYCGDSGTTPSGASFNRLKDVIQGAGQGGQDTIAANADTIEEEFKKIAETALSSISPSNVSADDGVPSLSSISANVAGEAGGYEYYKSTDGTNFSKWDNAPGATYSKDNGVTWDLSSAGSIPAGTTYRIRFTVWPSQEGYDLIADLNNGKKTMTDDQLTAAGIKKTANSDGTYSYELMTNTHLNTSYTFNNQEYSDASTWDEKAMPLPTKVISVKKNWPDNALDQYGAATYRDENGEEQTATEITLQLQKDKAAYLPVTVKAEEGWQKAGIYVSCGNMSVKNGVATIHETGHDYQIAEPEEFSYYWDLISDVYHPMVINGTATMLVLDEKAESADNNNTFEINGKYYTKQDDSENTLEADNYRRSNLNLTKVVSTTGGQNGYFTYTATVTDANSTDGKVWFSARDKENATVKDTDWVISGATAEEGNTGYWSAENGATVTFKIKQGWNVRFLNLYHGSTFSFEETEDMPPFYEFEKAETSHEFAFMDTDIKEDDWRKIESKKVSGTIVEPNNSYQVTYTNKYEAFYVYHSGKAGDGNLEVVGMPENGGTYDLTQHLTENTLYGGYYLDYAGKGSYQDDGIAADDGVAYTGMNYEWTGAQPVNGKAITPVAGETYYIKEVPTYYLRNYYQINYMKAAPNELKALYLISAVDDLNYQETGFTLTNNSNQKAKVVSKMTFKNYATNKSVTLKANTVFKSLRITEEGEWLTYFDASQSSYFAENSTFTVKPYWITPDGITINGISTRTIKITELTKKGISKTDS